MCELLSRSHMMRARIGRRKWLLPTSSEGPVNASVTLPSRKHQVVQGAGVNPFPIRREPFLVSKVRL